MPRRRSSSRRASRRGSRSVRHAKGVSILSANMRYRRLKGCSTSLGGGEPSLSLRRHRLRTGGSALYSWLVGPRTHIAIVSTTLGATDGGSRGVASHAAQRRTVVFGIPLSGRLAPDPRRLSMVRSGSLPAPLSKEAGLSHASSAKKAPEGSGGGCVGTGGNARTPKQKARIGRSAVALARRFSRSRSRQLVVWRRKAGASTSHDLEAFVDGRLASGRTRESVNGRARRDTSAESKRKPSRDRSRDQRSPRKKRES